MLTVAPNGFSVLALEGGHNNNEEQCVDCCGQGLVKHEFLRGVDFVQRFGSAISRRVRRKLFLKILLPENIGRATEEGEQHKMHNGHDIKGEWFLTEC